MPSPTYRTEEIAPDSAQDPIDIDLLPGHLIRRLHQISVGLFLTELEPLGLTPVQFGALQVISNQPGIDQRTLARAIALDASTTGGVVDRLDSRGLIERRTSPEDRRARVLAITDEGRQVLAQAQPAMQRVQELILAPLTPRQQTEFMHLITKLVTQNNEHSRAPCDTAPRS